jgi:putative transcriptional regulator
MDRQRLIEETREILAKTGFYISDYNDSRMICFDLVARRDNLLIILKLLKNVDSFSKRNAHELSILSDRLKGSPLIIGDRTSLKKIESGIVYFRHGIPMINFNTFYDYLIEGFPPLIYSAPGGFYVNIDGEVLHAARREREISLGALATKAGVSRKAVQMYEDGMNPILEIAMKLEDFLEQPLIKPINPFTLEVKLKAGTKDLGGLKGKDNIDKEIAAQLTSLGYSVVPITHCPFEALTEDKRVLIITGISNKDRKTLEKARIMTNLSKVTERLSVIFIENELRKDNLEGTPVINKQELQKIDDSEEIITLINERSSS